MVAISATERTALALTQAAHVLQFRDPQAFFSWGKLAGAGPIGDAIVRAFNESASLADQYAAEYDKLLETVPGMTGANAAHNATVETIMSNRGRFPPDGFTIRTDFPGGGTVLTEIPPASAVPGRSESGNAPAVAAGGSAEWRAAQSRVTSAAIDTAPPGAANAAISILEDARARAENSYAAG